MSIQQYVVGFCMYKNKVLLIRKCRPSWQAGGLNGIGGKVNDYENFHDAMVRECNEEAGITVTSWRYLGLSTDNFSYIVKFYTAQVNNLDLACSMTDEQVSLFDIDSLDYKSIIPPADIFIRLALTNVLNPIELIME